MYKVYLSGAITGLTYDAGNDWRVRVTKELERVQVGRGDPADDLLYAKSNIKCLNPMRSHEFLRRLGVLDNENYLDQPESFLVTDEFIGTRDAWDTMRADAIFCNLLGATRVSIGTMLELGMAHAARVPIIMVMEKTGNLHDHGMVRAYSTMRFDDLAKAIIATKALLCV